ncbi:MAG: hypothetical protein HY599_05940 [Candidatus Omnitrophica bacterium]|nr:hypothetical protein [Candidatus Omnitrophota bacterium]
MSQSDDQQLQVASTNQGGGTSSGGSRRAQSSIGGGMASHQIASSRFRILPGLFGGGSSSTVPVGDLDLTVLYAKTDAFGTEIPPSTWQRDRDPLFIWAPPAAGPEELGGYSYAVDGTPDDTIDTTSTSMDLAASGGPLLSDGTHTFSVKAINTLGNGGNPITIALWVDTAPPQIVTYNPAGASLFNVAPAITAGLSDAHSGVSQTALEVLINGGTASVAFDPVTGTLTASGGGWQEGTNSLELRVEDAVGNAQAPLVWSVTLDTQPPAGSVTVNGGAQLTTSVYVTLSVSASDATSGVTGMLISNEEFSGYVQEPYAALREFWGLNPVRGMQRVYVKFLDAAGNVSEPVSDDIELGLLSPETLITSGPAGTSPVREATFTFQCPEGACLFSYAFDNEAWSEWNAATTATMSGLTFGNHYFRVKAARDVNGEPGIQADEEDPSPADRTWIVGAEPSLFAIPKGPPIKFWRLD